MSEGAPLAGNDPRVLFVTNDFPPRVGGVQQYEWNLLRHLPSGGLAVLAPNWPGWQEHDADQPFPVYRWPGRTMWPTPDLHRRISSHYAEHAADVIVFGQGLPLPMLGPSLAAEGMPYVVLTHGYELWMARLPGSAAFLRHALGSARAVTAISHYTARAIRHAVPARTPLYLLPPAVDAERFVPDLGGGGVRERYALAGRRVILCVSRLIPRKGQDVLIRALPIVRRLVPDAALLIVGDGPYRPKLESLAGDMASDAVVFAGEVADDELPACYAACDVFAMPCRSRWGGLEVEGFGIVFLEAAASGRAALAGRSGGSEEAVEDELTGMLVEGAEPKAVALALAKLLDYPERRAAMGRAGRARVEEGFTWPARAAEMSRILRSSLA